jgi:rRNA maturation endonuclease Nob1
MQGVDLLPPCYECRHPITGDYTVQVVAPQPGVDVMEPVRAWCQPCFNDAMRRRFDEELRNNICVNCGGLVSSETKHRHITPDGHIIVVHRTCGGES